MFLSSIARLRTVEGEDSFEVAMKKYGALMLEEPDVNSARKVEETQLIIMRELYDKIDESRTLEDVLVDLEANGSLRNTIERVARELGTQLSEDPINAYRRLVGGEGDLEGPDATPIILAIQAIARAYAEKYEYRNGISSGKDNTCPLCGTESDTMIVEGREYCMVCPMCGHKWRISEGSPVCPRCGEDRKLGVYSDRGGILGLATCQSCGYSWHMILGKVEAPRIMLPLIAMGAERFRRALPDRE